MDYADNPSLHKELFLYTVIHWNVSNDRDGEHLRHTEYDERAQGATGVAIEVLLAFAVIRSYSDHHWMAEMGESIRRIGEIHSVIADITYENYNVSGVK